jgi:hypothetical protein
MSTPAELAFGVPAMVAELAFGVPLCGGYGD